jgi:dTDP-4-amino-4,6-dideoxygalactose transaminase
MTSTARRVPFLDIRAAIEAQRAEIDAAMARVLDSAWFIMGPELEAFEREFGQAVECRHCVGVGNGLEALIMGLRALGVGPGDEVVVPANTFIASWLAVTAVGADIVAADVDPITGLMDGARVDALITPRTRCIMPVHLYGHVVEGASLAEVAARHGIPVLEDAAQAHLARDSRGTPVGAIGAAAAFSFYPGKNLGALGDGGALVTNDAAVAQHVRLLRNYGSRIKYEHEIAGGNSRLDELQAAILKVRLTVLETGNARRRDIAERYRATIEGTEARMPVPTPGSTPVWHLAPVWLEARDELQQHLSNDGIDTQIHYPTPPHRTGVYRETFADRSFPVAERIARESLSLPIGPHLTDDQIDRVCDSLARFHRI